MGAFDRIVVSRQTFLSSSDDLGGERIDCSGHSDGGNGSQVEPFHHNSYSSNSEGKISLEAQSAGLSVPLMCFHLSGGMSSRIDDTLLPTKVLKRLGLPENQLSTMVLSVQAWMSWIER